MAPDAPIRLKSVRPPRPFRTSPAPRKPRKRGTATRPAPPLELRLEAGWSSGEFPRAGLAKRLLPAIVDAMPLRGIPWLGLPLLTLLAVPSASGAFSIEGPVPARLVGETLELRRESLATRQEETIGTRQVEDARFSWPVTAEPGLFILIVGDQNLRFVAGDGDRLVLDEDDEGNLHLAGSVGQEAFAAYEAFRAASLARTVYPVRGALRQARERGDEAAVEALTRDEVAAYENHRAELNDFVLASIPGDIALYASSLRWKGDYRLDELAAAVERFAAAHPDWAITREMSERIARFRQTQIGAIAPELQGVGPEGEPFDFRELRGNLVLIDFWASWCPPCRIANRDYARLYAEFHARGWEILAVSVDRSEAAWKRAIAQDRASWRHLGDLQGWSSPLAARYNVTALPSNFLLDRDGRILARDLAPDALETLLREHLFASPPNEPDLASE